ncbi:hypothetical protein ACJW31_03G074700 [Castanea mollissima]
MNYLDKISEIIFDCVFAALQRQLGYLINYRSHVDNLETKVEELRGARERVQREVVEAENNVKKIYADVQTWLNDSEGVIKKASKTIEDNGQANMTCCNGWCPNLKSCYQVGRRSYKMGLEVEESKNRRKLDSVGFREPPQLVVTVKLNKEYKDFKSRMPTINGVLEALKDPNINRIGVHGMGGVGKTMLVKEVVNQAEEENLFDNYVFVAVSKEPDLMDIQTKIAYQLGLELGKADEFGRQDLLRRRLQQGKILLVMDDIWTALKLEDVGYTFEDNQKGCKLLLTSRFHKVLVHNEIKTQKQFPVGILLKEEPRNLFEKIIGDSAKNHEIQQTMLQIVEECSGLPVAITTVANALKNEEDICVWKDALNQFKFSDTKSIDGMDEKVYKSIKWSYDFLKSREAKSLWLLCSLHGEDYDIKVEELIRYCVGWNLFPKLGKIGQVRCRVRTLVKELKDCSLLLDGDDNGTVKMHDIIRDVAIDIADEERHMFTIRSSVELQERSKSKNSTVISLPYINDDLELPNPFECSKLELLLLFRQKFDFRIPDLFFEGLKDLKVLKLSTGWSGVLPSSLSSLENLQTLCLDGAVQNAIIIGELKNLKALSLSLFDTERLPKEIGQLTHLQLLDLRYCFELRFIPPNVLSNLKRLEELYLPDDVAWEVEVQSTEKINAMVSELDHLFYLTKLHICIENAKILPSAMVFERLESYEIAIGSAWSWGETSETSRILKLRMSIQSDCGYKVLLRKCETLFLDEMKGVTNILYELDSEGFKDLKHLTVKQNDEIQYIIKSMGVFHSVFPSLESITLLNVNNLERISNTRLPTEFFCNLRVVEVVGCCKLEFVFFSSMVGCFSHLQEMKIEDCKIMSAIVEIEREEEIEVNSDESIKFANLHSLKLRKLFKLKGFVSVVDSRVLFNGKVLFPILKKLEIEGMDSMNMIWPDQLISDFFGKLETLTVSGCTNLTNIVPPNMLRMLRNLKELKIEKCGSIEEVFDIQGTNKVEESSDIAAAELISLTLRNLEKVKHVWSMNPQGIITFGKLRTIKIEGCSSLKSVFPTSVAKALMQLETLEIKDCATVEEIVAKEEGIETITLFVFPQLTTLELQNLPELKSFYPGNHTLECPLLKGLRIQKCDKLKIFGSNKSSVKETNGLGHHASLFLQPLFFVEKVLFPILKKLEIEGMDSMNMIWPDQLISDFFGKLETLTVSGCTNLTNIVPPNMLRMLPNLKELKIEKCGSIEEVFDIQGTNNVEESSDIAVAELISLTLRNLEKVKHVWSMNPQGIITFRKLRTIKIEGCSSLKSVFPTSVAKALMQLETLEIKDCATVEEIVAKEEGIETITLFVFPQLTTLELQNLPELKSFYPGNHTLECPLLKGLRIQKCDKLKIFGSNKSSVKETNGLGHHASLILQPLFFVEKVVFPILKKLEIEGMDSMNRTNIVLPNMLRMLPNLKELKIEKCGSVEEVFDIQGTNNVEESRDIATAELISLTLINLEKVKHVWSMDPQGIIIFGKLRTIKIEGCSSLKSFFPTSVAKALPQLEALEIEDCAMMEEIVAKEEGIETTTLFVFPQLTTLKLQNLPELKSFYPGNHTLECPSLKDLHIQECYKLKIFGSNKSSVEETNGLGHHASLILQPLFFVKKDKFPKLEYLSLDEGDVMNETCGGPSAEFCCNLKYLTLTGNGEIPNEEAPIARAGVSDFRRLKNIPELSCNSNGLEFMDAKE